MPAAFPPLLTSSRSDGLVGEVAPGVGTLRVAQQDSLPMLAPSEPSTVDPRVHAGRPSLDAPRAVARVTARPCAAHLVAAARVHMRVVGGRVAVSVLPAQAGGGIAPASPGVPEAGCSDVGSPPETGGGTTQCSARSASVGVVGIGGVDAERARTAGSVDLLACSEAEDEQECVGTDSSADVQSRADACEPHTTELSWAECPDGDHGLDLAGARWALDRVAMGGESQRWIAGFDREEKLRLRELQQLRMAIYEVASTDASMRCPASNPKASRHAKVAWAESTLGAACRTAPRHRRSGSRVASVMGSAFAIPDPVPPPASPPSEALGAPPTALGPAATSPPCVPPSHPGDRDGGRPPPGGRRPKQCGPPPQWAAGHGLRVLILFSGRRRPDDLAHQLDRLGVSVDVVDLVVDESHQLLDKAIQHDYVRRVQEGVYDAVFLAPPCSSFCVALEPQLRSWYEPEGITPTPPEWRGYLARHNALARFASLVCLAADKAGVPWAVENPASRRYGVAKWAKHCDRPAIWDLKCFRSLKDTTGAMSVTLAQCQFAGDFQKWTTLLGSASIVPALRRRFSHAVCRCSSHAKVAHGEDEFGESLTALSAEYPPLMNLALARALVDGVLESKGASPVSTPKGVAAGLHMGSPDPHELCLNDDKVVAHPRKRPTFAVSSHVAASDGELASRPLPRMNALSRTEPLPKLEPIAEEAPTVSSLRQLLLPDSYSRVARWLRRCRRCMRLASRGDWRAARRMRPPDLWLPASQSMVREYAAWDWDLTPCARGEPAVAVSWSGVGGESPPGSLNLDAFAELGRDPRVTDRAILDELARGVADDVSAPRGTFLCAPHTGALKLFSVAAAKLQAGVDSGWASWSADLPRWPIRCDPYSVVDESERTGEPKFRMTNDHSWPPPASLADGAGVPVPSLNGAMDRSKWPAVKLVKVTQMAESIAILQTCGVPVKAGVLDLVAFYKQVGRQRAEIWRNGSITADGFVLDERCCFGSAADATKCCRVSDLLAFAIRKALRAIDAAYPTRDEAVVSWLERRRAMGVAAGASADDIEELWASLHTFGIYVDDGGHSSVDDPLYDVHGAPLMRGGMQVTRATLHFEAVRETVRSFGFDSSPQKEQPPSTLVDFLGVSLNLSDSRMVLTERKRSRYASSARKAAACRTMALDEYLGVLGKLTFAAQFYPVGRQWLHAPWRAARARYRTSDGLVVLSSAAQAGLLRWADELEGDEHVGVPLAPSERFPPSASRRALTIYADAAQDCHAAGFCAWTVVERELVYVVGEWDDLERSELLICDLELAASTFGLVALTPLVGQKHVYSYTDNTVAMAAMRNLTPSTAAMQALTVEKVAWLMEMGVSEAAERVTSAANLWSDLGSRGKIDEVIRQAEGLGLATREVAVPDGWRPLLRAQAAAARASRMSAHACSDALPQPPSRVEPPSLDRSDARGACRDGRAAGGRSSDAGRAAGAADQDPQRCDGGRVGRRADDGRAVVAEVHRLRPQPIAVLAPHLPLATRAEGGDGEPPPGLLPLAGDVPTVGQADLGADHPEVRWPDPPVALQDVPHGALRRSRPVPPAGPDPRHLPLDRAARPPQAMGRAHAGPLGVDGSIPHQLRGGLHVAGCPDGRLLRPDARCRVRRAGRCRARPARPPHQGGRQDRGQPRRLQDPGAADAAGQGQAWADQVGPAAHGRRGLAARPGEGSRGDARCRPRASRA